MTDEKMKRFLNPRSAGIIERIASFEKPSGEDGEKVLVNVYRDGDAQWTEEQSPDWTDWDSENGEEDEVVHFIEPGSEEERESIREAKLTLRGMYAAFTVLTLVFLAVGLLLSHKKLTFSAGILTGFITGLFYITHLNSSIKEILNYDEDAAVRAMKKDARIRLGVVGIGGVLAAALIGGDSALGVLAQIFAIKLSAYLTPAAAGILKKINPDKGR